MKFTVILTPDEEDGGFVAECPSIPGCVSEGESIEEALANIKEAIELYLDPTEDDSVIGADARVVELVM